MPQRENVENRGVKMKNNGIVQSAISKMRTHKIINLKDYTSKRLEDWRKENI